MATAAWADSFISDTVLAPYERVTAIGTRSSPAWIVRKSSPQGRPKLFVAEHFPGVAREGDEGGTTFLAEARRLATLSVSNVARVIELVVRGDDAVAFSELVDGESLSRTWLAGGLPLEVTLRVVLDVLSAGEAIHALRDVKQRPMHLAHGEISPATVVVGTDGIARVLHAIARRLPNAAAVPASLGYLAPEVHAGETYDARADVFSAGVLLWEALSGKRLFEEEDPALIVARMHGAGAPEASPSRRTGWAQSLVRIAAKALSMAPADRWPTAAAMAAEIRKAAGLRLAPTMTAAAVARAAFGERTKNRRLRWETQVPTATIAEEPIGQPLLASVPSPPPDDAPMPLDDGDLDPPRPAAESAPYFDAAVDVSIPPPPRQPRDLALSAVPMPASSETVFGGHANRRRSLTVIGSVGALGLIVFALAGWRVAHRERRVLAGRDEDARAAAAPAEHAAPAIEAATPLAADPPAAPGPPAVAPPPAATPSTAASHAAPAHALPAPRARPARMPAALRTQRAKPKTTHGYDPSAL